jgi:hypothetical protein
MSGGAGAPDQGAPDMSERDPVGEQSWRYAGWSVVAALFWVEAVMFGFGFYGQGIYVAELRRLNGWPTALIATGTTVARVIIHAASAFSLLMTRAAARHRRARGTVEA